MASNTISSIIILFVMNNIILSYCADVKCPGTNWIECANKGKTCDIHDGIKEGYISYGANGRHNIIPFSNSNSDGTDFTVQCDNDFGEIINGDKYCCYISAENEFAELNWSSNTIKEDHWFDFGGQIGQIASMRYGRDERYYYRLVSGSKMWCQKEVFNNAAPDFNRRCQYSFGQPSSINENTEWVQCANEGSHCENLDRSSAHWIRYGDNEKYYYRLVLSDRVPCDNAMFDNPTGNGNTKYCWRQIAGEQLEFSNSVGYWERIPTQGGGLYVKYKKTIGIVELTEEQITDTWSSSLTASMSVKLKASLEGVGGMEQQYSLSTTVAQSLSTSISTSYQHSETIDIEYTCDKSAVYQWVVDSTQKNGITPLDFSISSWDFWCIDLTLKPRCIPGCCADDNCQTCVQDERLNCPDIDNI